MDTEVPDVIETTVLPLLPLEPEEIDTELLECDVEMLEIRVDPVGQVVTVLEIVFVTYTTPLSDEVGIGW